MSHIGHCLFRATLYKSFGDSMSWPRKQKAPAGALKHKLVLDGYHFCEVEQHLFVLHGIVWYGVTLELCGTELHLTTVWS